MHKIFAIYFDGDIIYISDDVYTSDKYNWYQKGEKR